MTRRSRDKDQSVSDSVALLLEQAWQWPLVALFITALLVGHVLIWFLVYPLKLLDPLFRRPA